MSKQKHLLALVFSLLIVSGLFSQDLKPIQIQIDQAHKNGTSFQPVHLFQSTNTLDVSAARFAQNAQFLLLQPELLKDFLSAQPEAISLVLPYNGQFLLLDLIRVDLGAEAQRILIGGNASSMVPVKSGLHYRGILPGSTASLAAFSFFEDEILGFISDPRFNNLVLGRVQTTNNLNGYMLYSDLELAMDNPFECTVFESQTDQNLARTNSEKARRGSVKPVRIALEADYALLHNRGGQQATAQYLSALFNQLATLYANESVSLVLSQLIVPDLPMYDFSVGNYALLEELTRNHANQDFDLLQLVGLSANNPESASYLDGLCTRDFRVAYCALEPAFSNVPTHSWALSNLAHELGHQFGAHHTQWCGWLGGAIESCSSGLEGDCSPAQTATRLQAGSTLMSYCLLNGAPASFAAGFGRLPGQLIRERIASATCMYIAELAYEGAQDRYSMESNQGQFDLVPNPAQSQVQIRLNQTKATRILVLDVLGRPLFTQLVSQGQESVQVDLNRIDNGIYLVQVFDGDVLLATKRLIKSL